MIRIRSVTLLEVTLVVAIIVLMAGAMTPFLFRWDERVKLEGALNNLLFNLRQTQQYALTQRDGYGYYGLFFIPLPGPNPPPMTYQIQRYEPATVSPPMLLDPPALFTVIKGSGRLDAPFEIDEHMTVDEAVVFADDTELSFNTRVIFTPEGSATLDGKSLLTDLTNEIKLRCGDRTGSIVISPVTGALELIL